jgi:general nucleoside transport system ATP-binding protein
VNNGLGLATQQALKLEGIVKRFGPVTALDHVDLALEQGEVHALLGENGAGKTTLMNIASGLLRPDAGTLTIEGQSVAFRSPRDAFRHGIGMVHQRYRLVENFTVAENLHVGWEDTPTVVSAAQLRARAEELVEQHGFAIDCAARVSELSVSELQRVAILRALVRGGRFLILDEPTAVLTPQEVERLFSTIRSLVADGCTVVFISHKLKEVLDIADRISVLRGGRRVKTLSRSSCNAALLAELMVGRAIEFEDRRTSIVPDGRALDLKDVFAIDNQRLEVLHGLSLHVAAGEVVGIAGISGNGQEELAEVITGMRPPTAGEIEVDGRPMSGANASKMTAAGVGHIPANPSTGMVLGESIEVNAAMKSTDSSPIRSGLFIVRSAVRELAIKLLAAAGMTKISIGRPAATLSGGQLQRILVHREIRIGKRLMVAVHPTSGLDIGATEQVHAMLLEARENRIGVVLISEDLDELLKLSDRLAVIYGGRIVEEFERARFDRRRIGLAMGGASEPGPGSSARSSEHSVSPERLVAER